VVFFTIVVSRTRGQKRELLLVTMIPMEVVAILAPTPMEAETKILLTEVEITTITTKPFGC